MVVMGLQPTIGWRQAAALALAALAAASFRANADTGKTQAVNTTDLIPDLKTSHMKHNMTGAYFGIFPISVDYHQLPSNCMEFTRMCELERDGDLKKALQQYEKRLGRCGTTGWELEGDLGHGHVAHVDLLKSPCGFEFAVKGTHQERLVKHIEADCALLKRANDFGADFPGAFPTMYYFSELTGQCYTERIRATGASAFLDHVNVNTTKGFSMLKRLFGQGIDGLTALRAASMRHQDLTLRNLLVRLPESKKSNDFQLVFIDFGGAMCTAPGHETGARNPLLGNRGFPDEFSLACSFFRHLYPLEASCHSGTVAAPEDGSAEEPNADPDTTSFHWFLRNMMVVSRKQDSKPDFEDLRRQLKATTGL